ncbi:hypothetical protein K1Y82_10585 [Bacillus inaquosorum]|nr:hypothetical protein K1Y82_10585 [Bacillus inaquosorum]
MRWYLIDESFLDVGKEDPEEMAKAIQSSMWREFGLMCTVGIGDNMLLSKLALDLESKKTKSGIARWRYKMCQINSGRFDLCLKCGDRREDGKKPKSDGNRL